MEEVWRSSFDPWFGGALIALIGAFLVSLWFDLCAKNEARLKEQAEAMLRWEREQEVEEDTRPQFENINKLLGEIRSANFYAEKPPPSPTQWERLLND